MISYWFCVGQIAKIGYIYTDAGISWSCNIIFRDSLPWNLKLIANTHDFSSAYLRTSSTRSLIYYLASLCLKAEGNILNLTDPNNK